MKPLPPELVAILQRQEGAVTIEQLRVAGFTESRARTLEKHGWTRPTSGVLVVPDPADPFRASVRAALLVRPAGVACSVTAVRLHELWGLRRWMAGEEPHLMLAAGQTYNRRAGVRLHSGLKPGDWQLVTGIPTTTVAKTVHVARHLLGLDELVCLLDSALRKGWIPSPSRNRKLHTAMALADARSESALETRLRLLLIRSGLAPESLQYEVTGEGGIVYARLDFAWPSVKLAVEADGREVHDAPAALYRDRTRANDIELDGWTILRFTWIDIFRRPEWVASQVRRALNPRSVKFRVG